MFASYTSVLKVRNVYSTYIVLVDGFFVKEKVFIKSSVADPGSGAFLTRDPKPIFTRA
jgi:hypothetical protein